MIKRINRQTVWFTFLLVFLGMIFAWRCFYSVGLYDEIGYLASLRRFLDGDRFLIDEWAPTMQLNTWIIYQLARFFPEILGESCVLYSRLIYIAYQAIITCLIYKLLYKEKCAWIVAMTYFASTPYNIPALCYNTMSIGSILLICVYITERDKWQKINYVLVGILLSLAVLSNPYVALLYIVYAFVCVEEHIRKKHNDGQFFSIQGLGFVTIGIIIVSVFFLLSLVGKGTLLDYKEGIISILNDEEHIGNHRIVLNILDAIWMIIRVWWRAAIPMGVIGLYTIFAPEKWKNRKVLLYLSVFFTAYGTIRFAYIYGSIAINMVLVPMSFFGVEAFFLAENSKKYRYALWLFIGYIFAICNYISTNTGVLSMSAMFIVPSLASILLILLCADEIISTDGKGKFAKLISDSLILLFFFIVVHLRITFSWFDESLEQLDARIERGPCKGMYTTDETIERYNQIIDGIDKCKISKDDRVLFLPIQPLPYLYSEGKVGSPYIIRFKTELDELDAYYDLVEKNRPTVVVITDCEDGDYTGENKEIVDRFIEKNYDFVQIDESTIALYAPDRKIK